MRKMVVMVHSWIFKEQGFHSLPLQPYRGHCFNILFENASIVFFLHSEKIGFLTGFSTNKLLKLVLFDHLFDLQQPVFLAGVKALGLVSKLVTQPLWFLVESRDINILHMNVHYRKLVMFLESQVKNPQNLYVRHRACIWRKNIC